MLRAANTGAPLDAAGVQALATPAGLGQARRGAGSVGRFGVGFAAVLAVSDEPAVRLHRPAACGSAPTRTRAEVAACPASPTSWPAATAPSRCCGCRGRPTGSPAGGLRHRGRPAAAPRHAAPPCTPRWTGLDAELLLALPGLAAIDVVVDGARPHARRDAATRRGSRLTDGGRTTTWQVAAALRRAAGGAGRRPAGRGARAAGLDGHLGGAAGRRRRARRRWPAARWCTRPTPERRAAVAARPADRAVPARPRPPARRSRARSPTRWSQAAADGYADLLAALPADPALLRLVPRVGLAAAELDAAARDGAVLDRLRAAAWLPAAGRRARPLSARAGAPSSTTPTDERVAALAGVLPGLLPADWSRRSDAPALAALGVRRVGLAEAVEAVRGVQRPAGVVGGALRGPGGRRPRGARRPAGAAGRRAHRARPGRGAAARPRAAGRPARPARPAARRPRGGRRRRPRRLLERLGARPATAAAVLADPAVRAAVEALDGRGGRPVEDGPRPAELAAAVLALVAAAGPAPGELPVAGRAGAARRRRRMGAGRRADAARLRARPPSWRTARSGVLDPRTAAATDPAALRAVGVLDTFALVRAEDPDDLDVDARRGLGRRRPGPAARRRARRRSGRR